MKMFCFFVTERWNKFGFFCRLVYLEVKLEPTPEWNTSQCEDEVLSLLANIIEDSSLFSPK
jgi:hypothetical protein